MALDEAADFFKSYIKSFNNASGTRSLSAGADPSLSLGPPNSSNGKAVEEEAKLYVHFQDLFFFFFFTIVRVRYLYLLFIVSTSATGIEYFVQLAV